MSNFKSKNDARIAGSGRRLGCDQFCKACILHIPWPSANIHLNLPVTHSWWKNICSTSVASTSTYHLPKLSDRTRWATHVSETDPQRVEMLWRQYHHPIEEWVFKCMWDKPGFHRKFYILNWHVFKLYNSSITKNHMNLHLKRESTEAINMQSPSQKRRIVFLWCHTWDSFSCRHTFVEIFYVEQSCG